MCNFFSLSLELSMQLLFFPFMFSTFSLLFNCLSFCYFCWYICYLLFSTVFLTLFLYSSSLWIVASTQPSVLANPLPPFFSCYILLYIVIKFLIIWSIWVLPQSILRMAHNIFRETFQVFIPLVGFLLQSLISRSFLLYDFFFYIAFVMASASNIPRHL